MKWAFEQCPVYQDNKREMKRQVPINDTNPFIYLYFNGLVKNN